MCWTCSVINEAELKEGKLFFFLSFQDLLGAQLLVRLTGTVQRWDLWGLESAQPETGKSGCNADSQRDCQDSAGTCSLCALLTIV